MREPRQLGLLTSPLQLLQMAELAWTAGSSKPWLVDLFVCFENGLLQSIQTQKLIEGLDVENLLTIRVNEAFTAKGRLERSRRLRTVIAESQEGDWIVVGHDREALHDQLVQSLREKVRLTGLDDGASTIVDHDAGLLAITKRIAELQHHASTWRHLRSTLVSRVERVAMGCPWNDTDAGARRCAPHFTFFRDLDCDSVWRTHGFEALRERVHQVRYPQAPAFEGASVLVGSNYVGGGLLDEKEYTRFIMKATSEWQITHYLAHRYESPATLARMEENGLSVLQSGDPLELLVLRLKLQTDIFLLPATPMFTVPSLCGPQVSSLVIDLASAGIAVTSEKVALSLEQLRQFAVLALNSNAGLESVSI
jgi:hypothetical protein